MELFFSCLLQKEGECHHVVLASFEDFAANVSGAPFDIVLIDLNLERGAAPLIEVLKNAPGQTPQMPCIFDHQSEFVATEAIRLGATGCLHVSEEGLEDPKIVLPFIQKHLALVGPKSATL